MYVLPFRFRVTNQRVWTRSGAISVDECDHILATLGPFARAQVGYPEPRTDESRQSDTAGLGWGPGVEGAYERLGDLATEANDELFGFDITGVFEEPSVVRYGTDGYHDWHIDLGSGPYSCRKLTLLVQLSDADDFDGGELELHPTAESPVPLMADKGDVVAFPTWIPHRVTPITSGTRLVLVAWVGGPPFR